MCRSIKTLRTGATVATSREVEAAALQFVRKISGFQRPTSRHEEAFYAAVQEITEASERLLANVSATLSTSGRSS
ncbi:MAG TPA: DUF2277 domain-containing protein [Dehalococcoidia bacterium]|jgi:hypothetical protein|nr:DUF2277 domain-containing protein [Dehalococcoidia bacterium]